MGISIHALTRRAAVSAEGKKFFAVISIHALTRRAAGRILNQDMRPSNFNPRSHEESGSSARNKMCVMLNFNPRSHEESGV